MRITTLLTTAVLAVAVAAPAFAQPPAGGGRGGPQMTPEERAAAFKTADKNADAKLSKEEFAATLPEQFRANADMIFPRRDANGDGAISLEEYSAAGRGGRGGPPPAGQ